MIEGVNVWKYGTQVAVEGNSTTKNAACCTEIASNELCPNGLHSIKARHWLTRRAHTRNTTRIPQYPGIRDIKVGHCKAHRTETCQLVP